MSWWWRTSSTAGSRCRICAAASWPVVPPASRCARFSSKKAASAPSWTCATSGSTSLRTSWWGTASMSPSAIATFPTSGSTRAPSPSTERLIPVSVDRPRVERLIGELLEAIGEDRHREGLLGTPRRVAAMYEELVSGIDDDPESYLTVTFAADHDEMVMVRDIPFASLSGDHMVR